MSGTYRQLPNGKWELGVSLGTSLSGKRIRKYKYVEAAGPREAEKLLAEFITESKRGDYAEGEKLLLKDFIELWKKDYAEKNLRKKTLSRYKALLERIIFALGHKKLSEIKPTHLLQFYRMLEEDGIRNDKIRVGKELVQKPGGLSPKTIRHHHALLSSMFQDAVEWGVIKENICLRVKPPKVPKKETQFYTINQAQDLLDALSREELKYRLLVILAIFTGFRRGEIMGLEWNDIDFKERTISVRRSSQYTRDDGIYEDDTKTEKSKRAVFVPSFVIDLLTEYKAWWKRERNKAKEKWNETNRLFIQWNGLPMHPDTISQWFPEFIRKNKLPHVTYHGLRHTHGSILLAMGMDLESVADQLGHNDIQMIIRTYGHNVRKRSRDAADHLTAALLNKDTNT